MSKAKSPSLRRIQADVRELAMDRSDRYHAAPLENDMFEWHFTIRGADKTDFEGGIYHGRILLPPEYPFKPPHIMFLTPSGRFETNTKICLSFSAFHPELWQPAWGIRLILEALIAFLPTPGDGAIGALNWMPEERKRLAKQSVNVTCNCCGKVADLLPELKEGADAASTKPSRFQKEIEQLRMAHIANESKNSKPSEESAAPGSSTENKDSEGTTNEPLSPPQVIPTTPTVHHPAAAVGTETTENEAPVVAQTRAAAAAATAGVPPQPVVANDDEAAAVQQQQENNPYNMEMDVSWVTDPMLNVAIALLAAICFLLSRKAAALFEELRELNGQHRM